MTGIPSLTRHWKLLMGIQFVQRTILRKSFIVRHRKYLNFALANNTCTDNRQVNEMMAGIDRDKSIKLSNQESKFSTIELVRHMKNLQTLLSVLITSPLPQSTCLILEGEKSVGSEEESRIEKQWGLLYIKVDVQKDSNRVTLSTLQTSVHRTS